MKRTSKYGLVLAVVLTFTFGSIITVSARPIDYGNNYIAISYVNQMWVDNAGNSWDFNFTDHYSEVIDQLYLYGFDNSTNTIINGGGIDESLTSKIDFRKGIATFTSSTVNINVYFDTDNGTYEVTGSRKEGNLQYAYRGPGTIEGSFTFNSIVYTIDGTVSGERYLIIKERHNIVK